MARVKTDRQTDRQRQWRGDVWCEPGGEWTRWRWRNEVLR